MVMEIGIAHRRTVEHQCLIEKLCVSFTDVAQFVEKVTYKTDVISVDLAEARDLIFVFAVMRRGMERFVDTTGRVSARKAIQTHLEGRNASEARLKGLDLQVEHEFHMFLKIVRH